MIRPIRQSFERALKAIPFTSAAARRALGRFYFELPGFWGKQADLARTPSGVAEVRPQNTLTPALSRGYLRRIGQEGRRPEDLPGVLDAPIDPNWVTEVNDNKAGRREGAERSLAFR